MQSANLSSASFRTRTDDIAFALCLSSFAVALAAWVGAASVDGPEPAMPAAAAPGQQQVVGTFAGPYLNGAPVSRLPVDRGEHRPHAAAGANTRPVLQYDRPG